MKFIMYTIFSFQKFHDKTTFSLSQAKKKIIILHRDKEFIKIKVV